MPGERSKTIRIVEKEMPEIDDGNPQDASRHAATPRWGVFFVIVTLLALPAGFGWFHFDGVLGLVGFAVGLGFGADLRPWLAR